MTQSDFSLIDYSLAGREWSWKRPRSVSRKAQFCIVFEARGPLALFRWPLEAFGSKGSGARFDALDLAREITVGTVLALMLEIACLSCFSAGQKEVADGH